MSLPSGLPTVTVTGSYRDYLGNPMTGRVLFIASGMLKDSTDKISIAPLAMTAILDLTGSISIALVATDATGITPTGFNYRVVERLHGLPESVYYIQLPSTLGTTVDLSSVARVPGPDTFAA
jgi:hypothetical protein